MNACRRDDDRPVSRRVLDDAIAWQLQLDGVAAGHPDRAAHKAWLAAHPDHARAWRQLAQLDDELCALPRQAPIRSVLVRSRRRAGWKEAAGTLALALAVGLGTLLVDRHQPIGGLLADYRTGTSERRTVTLPDNTVIVLNARSAVDVDFGADTRALRLRAGEVHIETAHRDPAEKRPFIVFTADGSLRALGTRFIVRRDDDGTVLTVTESAVLARAAACPAEPEAACAAEQRVDAGQRLYLTADALGTVLPAAADAEAWKEGMLVVDGEPLAAVVAELARYRPGLLRVAPDAAGLRVTGTLPLDDGERALAVLAASLPVRVVRYGNWLVSIEAAPAR
ncbi:FecR domain-containing protein [Thauera sp. Sel9]|uniref:FecR domain-containing protein n=1 Tax=Thauera sp. Sel9 TaxID=2974299 RepID=UPI0021E10ABF|nr:FecR domain-containing protein [Thauera sp. Sel9]MCV2218539.1 FecR domain-containing protein [Thauera sp. Sel9]